jgi:hypothetical protein
MKKILGTNTWSTGLYFLILCINNSDITNMETYPVAFRVNFLQIYAVAALPILSEVK